MKTVYLDFEFNTTQEFNLNVLCVSLLARRDDVTTTHNFWLQGSPEAKQEFNDLIESFIAEGYIFVAFHVPAEARSLLSLGINPLRIAWIDLAVEWRMLCNENFEMSKGKHLIEGKEKYLRPPVDRYSNKDEKESSSKAPTNLVGCIYKLLGVDINAENKDRMRELILSKNSFTESEKKAIMLYCDSDVIYLPKLAQKMITYYRRKYSTLHSATLKSDMLRRGEYAARTAIMEAEGYPINYQAARKFADSVKPLIFQLQTEINTAFPDINAFELGRDGKAYTQKKKNIQKWVEAQDHKFWRKTEKGSLQISVDAFKDHYSSKGNLDIFGNAFVKYLYTLQSLNGFRPKKGSQTIFDAMGSDERVRPWFGIYGAKTSRSQPKATSYIPLKARWMRVLIEPKPGRAIVAIDYSQQEFLIAGLLAGDRKMIKAYKSGDVYLYTGKLDGSIPKDGTKETHGELRSRFKSTVLGIQYGMGQHALARKITEDTGKETTPAEAQMMVDSFDQTYPDYAFFRVQIREQYENQGYLRLGCGWTMWGDNGNARSVSNFPVQGAGASIMRDAVGLAQDQGLDVILTLHDAIYVECEDYEVEWAVATLGECMSVAFNRYFKDSTLQAYAQCRMDPTIWGPGLGGRIVETRDFKTKCYDRYIDPDAIEDYERYKNYLH